MRTMRTTPDPCDEISESKHAMRSLISMPFVKFSTHELVTIKSQYYFILHARAKVALRAPFALFSQTLPYQFPMLLPTETNS